MTLKLSRHLLIFAVAVALLSSAAVAQRGGRGGGGRGGGGGARGGGGMPRGGGGGMPRGGGGANFSRSPAISSPRPAQMPARPGGGARPSTLPSRPSAGGRPAGGTRPGGVGGAGGVGNRPGGVGGVGNRPGGVGPGGIGNRPGIDSRPGGVGNRPGIDNRPGGVGGVGGIGNRPGIDSRPGGVGGVGGIGNRPDIDSRPGGVGGVGNRPGIDNRPGGVGGIGGVGNRPGIDNRPINGGSNIGSGNTINRGDVNVGGIRQGNLAGGRVDPGYGVRPPAYNNWRGAYWGNHRGWANGYWHGYHDNNNWGWGRFATGAALGVTAWALGSSYYDWGYASYSNPYYGEAPAAEPIVIQQTVAGGEPQEVSVPSLAYDYGQPIDTQAAPPAAEVTDPALAKFESAREAFRAGDHAGALRLTDEALKVLPNDATLHEFRALILFAVGKYDLAAGPLYAVLSVGPGWDWTTMVGLYPGVDVYTAQLRKLESYLRDNPASTSARFVLGYHYLTQGNTDAAVAELKQVVARSPDDKLSAQLVKQFSKPGSEPETPPPAPVAAQPAKPGKLPGSWTASPTKDTTIQLVVRDDGDFTWTVNSKGKQQRIEGKWSLADDLLTLAQSGNGGALIGRVTWQADEKWTFLAIGADASDKGLAFAR